jgi:5-methylthioadenosine/S-adenosylhomocysteine deaminase
VSKETARKGTKSVGLLRVAATAVPVLALAGWLGARGLQKPAVGTAPVVPAKPAMALEPVEWLITGPIVVTMDPARDVIHDGAVAIRGDTIVAVGAAKELEAKYEAVHALALHDGVLVPGLINGHTHVAMTLFRGLGDDENLQDWLQEYIFPAEARNVNPLFVRAGTQLGLIEMIESGTTTFADMYYFENDVAEVTKAAGERAVLGETVIGFPAPDNKTPAQSFAYTRKFVARWKGDSLITPAVAPHAIYTVSAADLRESGELSRSLAVPLLIHLAETKKEVDDSLREHHMTPVAYLNSLDVLAPNVTAAHCVWVDAADLQLLAEHNVGCVYNPSSNLKLADGMAPVTKWIAAGVPSGLGTDGAASNNNLDMMRQINFAAVLQKLATMDPTALPAEQALALATIDGARALHMQKEIGSIEVGKKADLAFLTLDSAHGVPLYNIYSQIVYALGSSDVRDVFVGGRPLMLFGKLTTLDEPAIIARARMYGRQVLESLKPQGAKPKH